MKKVALFLEHTVEDIEFLYPYHRLREADVAVEVVAPELMEYHGKKGGRFVPDRTLAEAVNMEYDGLFIPGGYAPDRLRNDPRVQEMVRKAVEREVPVAAVCHGPWVLVSARVLSGRKVTGYPTIKDDLANAGADYTGEPVEQDGPILTGTDPEALGKMLPFFLAMLDQ